MTFEMTLRIVLAASSGAAGFFGWLSENIWAFLIILLLGVLIGLAWGIIYYRYKAKYFSNEAERKIKNIIADFKREKDTSETILRELQVGVLAYSSDGRLITGNPSANALLGVRDIPQTLPGFLNRYGKDNGISLALMLQTNNVSGNVAVKDRTIRLRLTRAQLSVYKKPGWIVILQDVTEQEREDKQRKEFVANVSHELKTPLTTISAYSETLLDWGLEGKTIQDIRSDIARIHDDSKRMDLLVQNLLLLSSIDSRGIRPKMVQYDVVSLMRQVVSRMQVQAEEKNIELISSVLSIVPPVFGDPTAIDRILTNLVSNAIKYTDVNGRVNVSVQKTDNYISLKVVDNGMGVAKDNIPRLFDRFYRVDATGSRKYGGTGLGLSIAKELTELQGGTITVSSTLGKGSEFVVTIPKAETTYRETFAAILSDAPRTEILYENARQYLLSAAEEIDMPIFALNRISEKQTEELLSYLLMATEGDSESVQIRMRENEPMRENNVSTPVVPIPAHSDMEPRPADTVRRPQESAARAPEPARRPQEAINQPQEVIARVSEPLRSTESAGKMQDAPSGSTEPIRRTPVSVSRPVESVQRRPPPTTAPAHSDRIAKTGSGKQSTFPVETPIKRNADVVSPGTGTKAPTSSKEPSDRLTKSKIHPDNRQRMRLSDFSVGAESLHPRDSVANDKKQKEDKREN
ncbi:MAG: hypothetical protein GXY43_04950 [Clostridiaceae bacterium]|nr:hypothetical protein [Clostridiaceae bacterium]